MRLAHVPPALAGMLIVLLLSACDRQITRTEEIVTAASCFSCHSDANTQLVTAELQWENSLHASGENIHRNFNPCVACHVSEGFVQKVTEGTVPGIVDNPTPIHCFTCHAPHTNEDFSLRVTTAPMLQNGVSFDLGAANICLECHQSRRNVDTYVTMPSDTVVFTSSNWGPHHSVQGDMLIGSNGYEYSSFSYTQTSHRSVTTNGCLDCHFDKTSNLVLGGHSFNMSHTDNGETELNTDACETCHGSLDDFNYLGVQDNVSALMATLQAELIAANLIDATDHTISGRVVASSDSAGAVWNYLMALEDQSGGVHNRRYIEGLLESSIQFMQGTLSAHSEPAAALNPNRRY